MRTTDEGSAASPERRPFGRDRDGALVEAFTLTASAGVSATVLTLGATLQSLIAPDRDGRQEDIVLGHDEAEPYWRTPAYFGVTVGRYANRIRKGRFVIDDRLVELERNNGDHHLHGGAKGFDQALWTVQTASASELMLSHVSADGDGGYPGELSVRCRYALDGATLTIAFEATTTLPTVVNLTNHSYFNLAGAGAGHDALDHRLTLEADRFAPVDDGLIPTGELRDVAGTPFDFRVPARIGDRVRDAGDEQIRLGRGYDHNFAIRGERGRLRPATRLEDPVSGRRLDLSTTEAGLQLYSANALDGTVVGKGGRACRQGDAVCLEPQTFPDAPNRPEFPSARLDPGQTYCHTIAFRLSVSDPGPA